MPKKRNQVKKKIAMARARKERREKREEGEERDT
jgi:hypothetical protein